MNAMVERMLPAVTGLAIAIVFLVWSHAYDDRAQTVPVLIGWTAVALAILDIFAQTDTRPGRAVKRLLSGRPLDSSVRGDEESSGRVGRTVACLWVAVFVFLAALIGFIAAIPVYTIAFMRLQGGFSWTKAAAAALIIAGVTWVVFEQLLRYRVFEGFLFGGQF